MRKNIKQKWNKRNKKKDRERKYKRIPTSRFQRNNIPGDFPYDWVPELIILSDEGQTDSPDGVREVRQKWSCPGSSREGHHKSILNVKCHSLSTSVLISVEIDMPFDCIWFSLRSLCVWVACGCKFAESIKNISSRGRYGKKSYFVTEKVPVFYKYTSWGLTLK